MLIFFLGLLALASVNAIKNALIIIDIQNDFCPPNVCSHFWRVWKSHGHVKRFQGSLAVAGAFPDAIEVINRLRSEVKFDLVALTQDWHPRNHCSFYVNHLDVPGVKEFAPIFLPGIGMQVKLI